MVFQLQLRSISEGCICKLPNSIQIRKTLKTILGHKSACLFSVNLKWLHAPPYAPVMRIA